jgi:nicotinate-nucleotide--dimethylbenzimidazole phosphoribosyltransferase
VSLERPPLPPGFDDSRARDRRREPAAGRFEAAAREGVWRAITQRRDIRRFRPDPLDDEMLMALLAAGHQAPSVGLMQPWRFIVVRDAVTRAAMQGIVARERLVQADHLEDRARHYLDLKIEGIREAPVSICVCCDREPGHEVLGRHTIRDTDLYSTSLAIENLWLAATAEGVAIGWVSFYREDDVRELLGIPPHVVPVAWLCVGYPDERPTRPGLEAGGWGIRRPLADHVYSERWAGGDRQDVDTGDTGDTGAPARSRPAVAPVPAPPAWWQALTAGIRPGDGAAAVAVRDASDELVKPVGSLGGLETLLERWAAATGTLPGSHPSVAILVLAADHGVSRRGVSLYPARVGGQVAAAAARGETAIGVLARALGAELLVADVGLRGPRDPALRDRRIADGTADLTEGPALTDDQLRAAVQAGYSLAAELAQDHELIVLGEIGIGNTTVAAALLAALTGLAPSAVCGRGTGLDAQGVERKRAAVAAALAANAPAPDDPLGCLRAFGGLELAGLAGAMLGAAAHRRPVMLDGFATGVSALVACRLTPPVRDYLIAGHRSAEPAHQYVLTELGLEPLLDLRLRLGEASGAALAVPLVGLASRTHSEMRGFDAAGVDRPSGD